MKKRLARRAGLAALSLVTAGTLAACGSAQTTAVDQKADGSITYSFWGSPARAEKVQSTIDIFEADHPGAKVKTEVADYVSYVERLTVRAAGGDLACAVGTQSTFLTPYADKGVLRPLDDLIKQGIIDVSDIPKDVLKAGQVDGKQYMLPTGIFVRILGYNKDLVTSSGAPAPADDFTWEEYAAWLRDVQKGLPDGVYASEIEGGNIFSLTSYVKGHGQQMFKDGKLGFDKALLTDWFTLWTDLTADGVTVPPASLPAQVGALELTPLALGQAAVGTRDIPHLYITEQTLAANGLGGTVGYVPMPTEDANDPANVVGANGISIPAKCDEVATAGAFINTFANSPEAAVAFQSDNGILTNSKAQEALLADAGTPDGVKQNVTILRDLTDAGELTSTTYPDGLGTLTNDLTRIYQELAFGQTSVDDAVDQFFTAAEEALN